MVTNLRIQLVVEYKLIKKYDIFHNNCLLKCRDILERRDTNRADRDRLAGYVARQPQFGRRIRPARVGADENRRSFCVEIGSYRLARA